MRILLASILSVAIAASLSAAPSRGSCAVEHDPSHSTPEYVWLWITGDVPRSAKNVIFHIVGEGLISSVQVYKGGVVDSFTTRYGLTPGVYVGQLIDWPDRLLAECTFEVMP